MRPDGGVDGLLYAPFVEWIRAAFGIVPTVGDPLSVDDIVEHVRQGDVVIAAVTPEIRRPDPAYPASWRPWDLSWATWRPDAEARS